MTARTIVKAAIIENEPDQSDSSIQHSFTVVHTQKTFSYLITNHLDQLVVISQAFSFLFQQCIMGNTHSHLITDSTS